MLTDAWNTLDISISRILSQWIERGDWMELTEYEHLPFVHP
jgi:hypothetical protein